MYVHVKGSRGESLMSSSLHLQQCPPCIVHLIWMVLEMEVRWQYSRCFVGCCFQDLFNIACSILVQFSSNLVNIHVVHPYCDTTALKKLHFILSDKSDFHMMDNLSIAVHAFASHTLMSFSVVETLLPRYMKLSTSFREPLFKLKMSPFWLKYMSPFCLHSHQGLCSRELAWVGVFARSDLTSAKSRSVVVCVGYRLLLAFSM